MTKVKAISSWFVVYNSPSFTNFKMRIYADQLGLPSDVLFEMDKSFIPGDLLTTHAYGLKEVRFDNANPIWLRANTRYHAVPFVTGAAFTASSYIAWVKGFPDPNTDPDNPVTTVGIATVPFYLAMIGADR
jgi:hypothetical protein